MQPTEICSAPKDMLPEIQTDVRSEITFVEQKQF